MRIALVGNAPDTLIRFRSDLIRSFIEKGHEVYAFAPGYSAEDEAVVRSLGAVPVRYELDRTDTNPIRELGLIVQYRKLFKKHRINMVFSYFVKPVIYASIAARLAGIEQIYSMLGGLGYLFTDDPECGDSMKRKVLRTFVTPMFRLALSYNRTVFFQNPDDRDEFIRRKLVSSEKAVRVYGSGVNLDRFTHSMPEQNSFQFVSTGRLLKEKGFREYAEAAKRVKKKFPEKDIRFVLLGGYDENPAGLSKEEVEEWASSGTIEWPGRVNNVDEWLMNSSVFVLPSYREGTPRSSLEAMAVGRAIITTDVPGCRETVIDGQNGFLVPSHNADALAEKMEEFILNPDLITEMGMESRKLAEEYFDVRRVNSMMMYEMRLAESEEVPLYSTLEDAALAG